MSQQPPSNPNQPQETPSFWGNMQPPPNWQGSQTTNQPFNPQYPSGQYPPLPQQGQFPQGYSISTPPQNYQQFPQGLPQQSPLYPQSAPQKWYTKNVGILALLIFFFPIGLYLMWRYSKWPKNVKWIVTGVLAFCVLIGGITNASSSAQQANQAPTQQSSSGSSSGSTTGLPTDTPAPTDTPVPTDTPTPKPSLAVQLATIDAGSTPDSATITKYQTLLDSLHTKTGDSEQTISDETVNGQTLVKNNYGKDVSLLELLQQADASDPGGNVKIHYNELLAAYITLAYSQQ